MIKAVKTTASVRQPNKLGQIEITHCINRCANSDHTRT